MAMRLDDPSLISLRYFLPLSLIATRSATHMSTSTTILMIKTASELLAAFILAERRNVESIAMSHMPTLGTAYERIVSSGIDSRFVLPPSLGLRVVSGFIQGLPNQIDCMLVRGDGVRYGLTDEYIYPIDQVLCVLEIKKTLYKSEFQDGMAHLAAVQKLFLKKFADEHWRLGESAFDQARLSFLEDHRPRRSFTSKPRHSSSRGSYVVRDTC